MRYDAAEVAPWEHWHGDALHDDGVGRRSRQLRSALALRTDLRSYQHAIRRKPVYALGCDFELRASVQ